jgi:hypothetical protein
MAGCFLAQEVYLRDTGAPPSQAHAPVARFVGFAPLSLTLRVVGDRCRLQVHTLRFAQGRDDRLGCGSVKLPRLGSGEVLIIAGLEQTGLEQEEGGDQIWVAADDAKLAAELLFPVGHVTATPFPLPVREAAV